ncbi:oligosaccharide flippase family protein [Chloroflexota bacterium]
MNTLISLLSKLLASMLHSPFWINAVFLFLYNGIDAFSGIIFWIIATHSYSAEVIGLSTGVISVMGLLAPAATLGVDAALVRFLPEDNSENNSYINAALLVSIISSIVMAIVFILGIDIWTPSLAFIKHDIILVLLFVFSITAWTLYKTFVGIYAGSRHAVYTTAQSIIASVMRLVLLIAFVLVVNVLYGVLMAWGCGILIAVIVSVRYLLKKARPSHRYSFRIPIASIKKLLRFSLPYQVGLIARAAPLTIIPLIVLNSLGSEANAYFYFPWIFVNQLVVSIPVNIGISLVAEGAHSKDKLSSYVARGGLGVAVVLIPIVVLTIFFAGPILTIFGNDYVDAGTPVLRLLIFSAIPLAINELYVHSLIVQKRLKTIIGIWMFVAVTSISLAFTLVGEYGMTGIVWAWLLAHGTASVYCLIFLIKNAFTKRIL